MDKNVFKIAFIFLLSISMFFLFEIFFKDINIERVCNFFENILFATLLIIIFFFIKSLKFKLLYLKCVFVLFNISLLLETFYYYHFEGIFSVSTMFVIFETNCAESVEFLMAYFNGSIIFLSSLTLVLIIWGLRSFNRDVKNLIISKRFKLTLIFSIFLILIFLKLTKLIVYNVPYLAVMTPISYFQEMQKFKAYGEENTLGNFTDVRRKNSQKNKELYIIVVG